MGKKDLTCDLEVIIAQAEGALIQAILTEVPATRKRFLAYCSKLLKTDTRSVRFLNETHFQGNSYVVFYKLDQDISGALNRHLPSFEGTVLLIPKGQLARIFTR